MIKLTESLEVLVAFMVPGYMHIANDIRKALVEYVNEMPVVALKIDEYYDYESKLLYEWEELITTL